MHRLLPPLPLFPLLLVLLLPAPALAAKWVSVGDKGKAHIEVDSSSMTKADGGKLRVWYREVYATPKIPESGAFSFSRLTVLSELQCDKRSAALIQNTYTTASDVELKSERFDAPNAKPVAPDSTLELVFDYACKRQPKPIADAMPPAAAVPVAAPAEIKDAPNKSGTAKNGKKDALEPPHEAPHWSYSGENGAEKWGSLDKEFETCGVGQRQSPIDIHKTVLADLPPIQFAYKPVPLSIIDNGHSIRVDTPGAGGITVDGESYELQQLHFHKPSEEKINGKTYAMVAHLVHQSKAGKSAVVAVLLEAGKEQSLIRTLWTNLPLEQNKAIARKDVKVDPTLLIPTKRNYYTFLGSLTTPPCTEGVLWLVLKTPITASKEQLAGFGTLYKNNARPVQAVNNRLIKESR